MSEECDALRKRVDELTAQLGFVVAVADDRKARVDALTDALRLAIGWMEEVEGVNRSTLAAARRVLGEAS